MLLTFAPITKKVEMESKKENLKGPTIFLMDEAKLTEVLHRLTQIDERLGKIMPVDPPKKDPDPLSEYIPKSMVRGKILAASTLWKFEKKGNLSTYAIGGKRYYKRSEIENLIQEVKK